MKIAGAFFRFTYDIFICILEHPFYLQKGHCDDDSDLWRASILLYVFGGGRIIIFP